MRRKELMRRAARGLVPDSVIDKKKRGFFRSALGAWMRVHRDDLLQLARRDGVHVSDVLVADASRRTTAENAYVSGFGRTRRIVLYDTLLRASPAEIRLVVAHLTAAESKA